MLRTIRLAFVVFAIAASALADEQSTSRTLESLRDDPLMLRRFLEEMPKGGDLHEHLFGTVYAETFLRRAIADGLCIDRQKLAIVAAPCDDARGVVPASTITTDGGLYAQMIDAMSMRNFRPGAENGHDHFFATFNRFRPVGNGKTAPDMLAEVVARFAAENVDYIESLFAPDFGAARQLGALVRPGAPFAEMRDTLLKSGKVAEIVATARKNYDAIDARLPAGKSTVRYLYEVHRAFQREAVFAELLVAFETASVDPRVVGINPVQPEDAWASMENFDDQMAMFVYLRGLYPKVRLSAHAGELAPGVVPPEGLRNHIRDSVMIAKAERIGHGVDIARETGMPELLRVMAERGIAVEICLTSNDSILGVTGRNHPLRLYMRHNVPVVLATDDPGISRSDLTTEFQRAVTEHGLTYAEIKRLALNSIRYSFLDDQAKARELARLEKRLREFEAAH